MRPLLLKMTAFGPHCDTKIVDLEQLGTEGIYLLSGATGSGKTTLFDGISYAFFREPAGSQRKEDDLRCDFAPEDVAMEVELTFAIGQKKYHILRKLVPESAEKNPKKVCIASFTEFATEGEGKDKIIKTKPDGGGITNVNNGILQVLRVGKNQFSQIAMIAQGDFQNVLLAETSQRTQVYQKIFLTEKYNKLQERLKVEKKVLKDALLGADQELLNFRKEVKNCQFDSESLVLIGEKLRGKLDMNLESELEVLIENHQGQVKVQLEKKVLIAKENDEIIAFFTELKTVKEVVSQKETVKKQLLLQKNLVVEAESARERTLPFAEEIKGLQKLSVSLERKLEICEDIKKLNETMGVPKRELAEFASRELRIQEEKEKKHLDLIEKKTYLVENQGLDVEMIKIEQQVEEGKKKSTQLDSLEVELESLTKIEQKREKEQKTFVEQEESWKKYHDAWYSAQQLYFSEQAGILAEQLVEGEPCMVCGSMIHPEKAVKSLVVKTKDEIEELEKKTKKQLEKLDKCTISLSNVKESLQKQRGTVLALGEGLLASDDTSLYVEKIQEERRKISLEDMEKTLKDLKKIQENLHFVEERIPVLEAELEALTNENAGVLESKARCQTKIEELLKQISEKEIALEGDVFEGILEKLTQFQREIASKQKMIEDTESDFIKKSGELQGLLGQKVALDQQSVRTELLLNEEAFSEKLQVNQKEKAVNDEEIQELTMAIQINQGILGKVQENSTKVKELRLKEKWLSPLAETANGENTLLKTKLETFVQLHYFEGVLEEANVVYHEMNRGKYTLVRGEACNGRKEVGLEIYVVENGNGTVRSAATLSGGEAFQASLALALGFSALVQKKSNAVKMESLFLDEGFGTLDPESLDHAITALTQLAGSGRLVGVISHVESMKSAIGKQILFENMKGKTSIKVVV